MIHIMKGGYLTEGLFRIAGSSQNILALRKLYEGGHRVDLCATCQSHHTAASLLKQYLRELSEPLIDYASYEKLKVKTGMNLSNEKSINLK